jgi:hypothetical protein
MLQKYFIRYGPLIEHKAIIFTYNAAKKIVIIRVMLLYLEYIIPKIQTRKGTLLNLSYGGIWHVFQKIARYLLMIDSLLLAYANYGIIANLHGLAKKTFSCGTST